MHRCECNIGSEELKKGVIRRKKNWKVWFDVKNIALAAHHGKYNDIMNKKLLKTVRSMVPFLSRCCCWLL